MSAPSILPRRPLSMPSQFVSGSNQTIMKKGFDPKSTAGAGEDSGGEKNFTEVTFKSGKDGLLLCGGGDDEQDEAVAALLHRPPLAEEKPVKMSLMALLADDGGYSDDDGGRDEEFEGGGGGGGGVRGGDEEEEEDEEEREMEHVCCVCMVRHKGAAFIPCGHTFCRLCSRELWVSRGNCPLCNGFILEILDIF